MAVAKTTKKKSSSAPISDLIREDSTYLRSKKQFERIMQNVDPKMLMTELFSLHASRGVAALRGSQVIKNAQRVIIDSSIDEISVRSRTTTIQMSVLQAQMEIEEVLGHLSKYLLQKYPAQLKENSGNTLTAMRSTIDVYLRSFIEVKKKLEGILKIADLVLKDIDQASYGLSRIENAIESAKKDR